MMMNKIKVALVQCLKGSWAPPLQLAYMATYARQRIPNAEFRLFDVNYHNVLRDMAAWQPDLIGFSILTPLYPEGIRLAQKIKSSLPHSQIFIGGHHISAMPQSLDPVFDFAVLGEGEQTTTELIAAYASCGPLQPEHLAKIKGVAYRQEGQLHQSEKRELIEPLDSIPIPDRNLLPRPYITTRPALRCMGWKKMGLGNIFTGRGCPYKCTFCASTQFWGKVRLHSAARVVEEIAQVHKIYHTDFIHIEDDLFAINKKRVAEVTEELRQNHLLGKVFFGCQPRMNLIDDDMCRLLREMGVVLVGLGFESGNADMMSYLKGTTASPEIGLAALRLLKQHGFMVQGNIMFGNPGETWPQLQESWAYCQELIRAGIDDIFPFITTPLPGTVIWDYAREKGIVTDDPDWNLWQFTRPHPQRPSLYDPAISPKQFADFFFGVQAQLEKHRPLPPLGDRIRRLPHYFRRAWQMPGLAWQIFKHRHL